MRSTLYFLPLRTSVTDSVGISTLPILSSRPKARTRDSSDSFTLRSNPEYEWMMYHFILGLRGCSATAAPPSAGGALASVALLLVSSGIIQNPFALFSEKAEEVVHASANRVINDPEVNSEQKYRDQHHAGGRLHFLTRGRGDFPHLGANVVVESFCALRPGFDLIAKIAARSCDRIRHFFRFPSHHCTQFLRFSQNSGRGGGIRTPKSGFGDRQFNR